MRTYYSPVTGSYYSSKEQMLAYEKKYMAELQAKQNEEIRKSTQLNEKIARENANLRHQEIALENQRLAEARENAMMIANATKETEEKRFENELYIQQRQYEKEKELRYYKLCDELGLNYDDILKMSIWIEQPTKEQISRVNELTDKYNSMYYTDDLKNLYDLKHNIEDQVGRAKYKLYNDSKNKYVTIGNDRKIDDYISSNNKRILICNFIIAFFSIMSLGIGVTIPKYLMFFIIIAGIIDGIVALQRKKYKKLNDQAEDGKTKNEHIKEQHKIKNDLVDKYQSELEKINYKINEAENQRKLELEKNDDYNNTKEELEKMLNCIKATDGNTLNGKLFKEFRKNHYNIEAERLFRKIGIDNFVHISEEEIISNGTIEDYNVFIEKTIFSMGNLYFDNYSMYEQNAIQEYIEDKSKEEHDKMKQELQEGKTETTDILIYNTHKDFLQFVFENIIITKSPEELKVVIIETEGVNNIDVYEQSPNLLLPITNEFEKAVGTLAWLMEEIKIRNDNFKSLKAKNITEYNTKANNKIPQLLFIINNIDTMTKNVEVDLVSNFKSLLKDICTLNGEKYGFKIIATIEGDTNETNIKDVKELFKPLAEEELKKEYKDKK